MVAWLVGKVAFQVERFSDVWEWRPRNIVRFSTPPYQQLQEIIDFSPLHASCTKQKILVPIKIAIFHTHFPLVGQKFFMVMS